MNKPPTALRNWPAISSLGAIRMECKMEPETDQERDIRQAKLKKTCEELGLMVSGSIVVAPLAKPVAVDASAIDQQNLVASLMYLAFESGKVVGRSELQSELKRLLA